jgi:hypothetical protein
MLLAACTPVCVHSDSDRSVLGLIAVFSVAASPLTRACSPLESTQFCPSLLRGLLGECAAVSGKGCFPSASVCCFGTYLSSGTAHAGPSVGGAYSGTAGVSLADTCAGGFSSGCVLAVVHVSNGHLWPWHGFKRTLLSVLGMLHSMIPFVTYCNVRPPPLPPRNRPEISRVTLRNQRDAYKRRQTPRRLRQTTSHYGSQGATAL